jgi:hypothetical protein
MVGEGLARAIEAVPGQLGEARNVVADELGRFRTPGNVASDIRQQIGGAAETETTIAQTAARQADEAARANWERTNQAREQAIGGYEARSAQEAGQQVGNVPTTDMGNAILDTVRANHEAVRDRKNALYTDAGQRDGMIFDTAAGNADRHVAANLQSDVEGRGVVTTDPETTKAANAMRRSLNEFSQRARERRAAALQDALERERQRRIEAGDEGPIKIDPASVAQDVEKTGLNLQRIEQQRKILNSIGQGATDPADRRAAGAVMNAFDEWQQRAMQGRHYEGDPEALPAFLRARAANRDYRERFGYNEGGRTYRAERRF